MELMIVIVLISMMLFISVPKFQDALLNDNTKKSCRFIIGKIQTLKEASMREQSEYILRIGVTDGSLIATKISSDDSTASSSIPQNTYKLPGNVKIIDVEYPDGKKISQGEAEIKFYPKGYSNKAIIHLKGEDDQQISFFIEPFLSTVRLVQSYKSFEN
ncbi:MAG: hypothetical protein HQK79_14105 [Desulfobacterales bacterium]|nr:hypothetical protein [Desulfobacterales bacterium]MBF0396701.1 hypothetical protein [Desulfobacterales bacterium]